MRTIGEFRAQAAQPQEAVGLGMQNFDLVCHGAGAALFGGIAQEEQPLVTLDRPPHRADIALGVANKPELGMAFGSST